MRNTHSITLDRQDIKILEALQRNGRLSNVELSELVHLSASQCQRRRQKLEETGVVRNYIAQLDPEKIGLGVMALVSVSLDKHSEKIAEAFRTAIIEYPEVLECWGVAGDADYMLKIVAPDLKAFADVTLHRLLNLPMVSNVKSNLLLQTLKSTTELPVRWSI
ncbi:Lrp/AsnC family transcriptional regulator [Marinobacterium rhizophilum]|uniref:Lrp/AsnC family transcriptional regulator n=1 Tax=Marinobacterium rhizophilum TaxID=420402 RepID=A0ABY5HFT6_9GAMM|nr:Lrp/AsnC family transcriptional regulator [Marinobacterium rhizophilum]UTW10829.1 Lrp/AsnC family transcriptional regulator [Marinobacterium rhizophilum]